MTADDARRSIKQIYMLTAVWGVVGFLLFYRAQGIRAGAAFALGAFGSLVNLWLLDWLGRAISPGAIARKPWRARAFTVRLLLLTAVGYTVVKTLSFSPLAVGLGLLSGAAAVMVWLILQIVFLSSRRTSH